MGITVFLGCLVGIVVVAQTLYTSAMEHIKEFGTVKAIGGSNWDIYRILGEQALIAAVVGFALGGAWPRRPAPADGEARLKLIIPPSFAAAVFVGTRAHVPGRRHALVPPGGRASTRRSCSGPEEHPMKQSQRARPVRSDVTQDRSAKGARTCRGAAAASTSRVGAGRGGRARGAVGLGQDHASLDPGLHPHADLRHASMVDGEEVDAAAARPAAARSGERSIGFVFQQYNLFPALTRSRTSSTR